MRYPDLFAPITLTTLPAQADSLGAAVGASRVAVDEGRLPRARRIGGRCAPRPMTSAAAMSQLRGVASARRKSCSSVCATIASSTSEKQLETA